MNKTEAAELLGVSEKTVSRYVSSGKLPARYVTGKTGKQLDFEQADLEAFKLESEAPVEVGQAGMTALVLPQATAPTTPDLAIFAELVRAVVAETRQDTQLVPTSEKMVLSLDEAAALSGVPRGVLNEARRDGRLRAQKIGRGYKVLRADLGAFVAGLFEVAN